MLDIGDKIRLDSGDLGYVKAIYYEKKTLVLLENHYSVSWFYLEEHKYKKIGEYVDACTSFYGKEK